MKRILLVSYYYPPQNNARSIRMYYFTKSLLNNGYKVDVLTSSLDNIDTGLQDLLSNLQNKQNLRIFNTEETLYKKMYKKFQKDNKNNLKNHDIETINKRIKNKLKLFAPRPEIFWFFKALKKGFEIIEDNKYYSILSSSLPFESHHVSYYLSCHGDIPLVLEYGDPWTYSPTKKHKFSKYVYHLLESKILEKSEYVIFTTKETKKLYKVKFNITNPKKIKVIYSGFDPRLYGNKKEEDEDFTISYIGRLKTVRADIQNLLKASKELSERNNATDIRINLIGGIDIPIDKYCFSDSINIKDSVSFKRSLQEMQKSNLLILLGNKYGVQIPMKTFWYLGANVPILTILGDKKDPLKNLLFGMNRVVIVNNNYKEIKNALFEIYDDWKSGNTIEKYRVDKNYVHFTWKYQLEKLLDILKKL